MPEGDRTWDQVITQEEGVESPLLQHRVEVESSSRVAEDDVPQPAEGILPEEGKPGASSSLLGLGSLQEVHQVETTLHYTCNRCPVSVRLLLFHRITYFYFSFLSLYHMHYYLSTFNTLLLQFCTHHYYFVFPNSIFVFCSGGRQWGLSVCSHIVPT